MDICSFITFIWPYGARSRAPETVKCMDIGKLRTRQINKDVVHSQSFWQTIICLAIVTWLFAGWALTTAFLLFLLGTNFFWVTLLYFPWYVYDRGQENFGRKNRRLHILRELKIFHSFSKYFPVRLVKTADLPAHRNYIFGYHPHGIGGIGSFCCFLTEGANFKALFPELTPHQLITRVAFWWPGTREFFMGLGGSSATRQNVKSITRTLGNAMIVHVGGAAESLEAHPGSTRFVLKHRKGFIRMALENG